MEVNRPNITARWGSTLKAVRETLYAAKRAMTVAEIVEVTEGSTSAVRSALDQLAMKGTVRCEGGRPAKWVHSYWRRAGLR